MMNGVFLRAPDLRASAAEREAVARALTRHYSAGRLTDEELSARVDAAYRARWDAELAALTRDLPLLDVEQPRARRVPRLRGALLLLVLVVSLAALADALPHEMLVLFTILVLPMLAMLAAMLAPLAIAALGVVWVVRTLRGPRRHPHPPLPPYRRHLRL
jgi:hypothetical protein